MKDKFNITIVRSRIKSRPYAKTDGKYLGPTYSNDIGLQTIENNPENIFALCETLLTRPDTCVVYGTAVKPEIIDTNRKMTNFTEEPIHQLILDLDSYEVPKIKNMEYNEVLQEVDKFVDKYLPPEFQDTTYIIRFSSSFLLKEKPYLRCHLIFLLEEPQYPREIGLWIKKDKIPADASFYLNLTQPIFTAGPLWRDIVDPLTLKGQHFPRIVLIKKNKSHVLAGWLPFIIPKKDLVLSDIPAAYDLPGKIGSFCRMTAPEKIMKSMGYAHAEGDRYLSATSKSEIPGAVVFKNGYVYSHHDNDPINQIVEKIYNFKRRSLNSYDLAHGWAVLNKDADISIFKEFEFMLSQAIAGDQVYQEEVQKELVYRTEWLVEGDYKGANRKIIDGVIQDMYDLKLTELSREYLFNTIKEQTKNIKVTALRNVWKNLRKDHALHKDAFDPDANLRHMANIFKRQKIIYSHHKNVNGDFWCYFPERRIWKRCNNSQTQAFIYNHIHATIPLKIEISYNRAEQLIKIITREACLSMSAFPKGKGWAFKGGRYGLIMDNIFSDSHQWQSEKSIRTLRKDDHIYKELPITYTEWKDNKNPPTKYIDFLVSSSEEDLETVEMLREYGGYILADSYHLHKMLIIEGVPGGGKSIFSTILQACIGHNYHAAVSLKGLAGDFGLGTLPGKKLAVLSEAKEIDFETLKSIVPVFLKITGQDYIDTMRKGIDANTELLECKLLLLTNRTPVLPDDTGALAQRIMMVRFNKTFRGTSEDILGLDKIILETELASIIRWHLQGLEALSKRKHFIEPETGLIAKHILEEQIDPLKTFITQHFAINLYEIPDYYIVQSEFILYFRAYCKRIGQPTKKTLVQKRASIRSINTIFPKIYLKSFRVNDKITKRIVGLIPKIRLGFEFADELAELT